MWSHYAGDHSGAVIKHKVIPGKDYPICAAMPVQYREIVPVIAGVDDYIKHVTGQKELNFKQITIDFFTTKSKDWSYEREWRCVGPPASDSEGLFDFSHIATEEIEAIYFGCRMTESDREKIIENMSPDFSHVKLFQAKKHPEKYALDFDLIARDSEIVS